MRAVDSAHYLVSTDGGNFAHPDDAALARILLDSARPATIHCNYASDRTVPWVARATSVGGTVAVPRGKAGLRVSA